MPSTLCPPSRNTAGPSVRPRWRRRFLRLALGFAAVLAIGNLLIVGASVLAKTTTPSSAVDVPDAVSGIRNFEAVDATLWRGGAPTSDDYRALAAAGVTTVVDLRAEANLQVPDGLIERLGMTRVAIPIRDGQTPTDEQVQRFLDAADSSEGTLYLHCGAGVGRTGTMTAVYRVSHGGGGWSAMRANLAVGPPSLEQLAYAAALDRGEAIGHPNGAVVAVSRTLDAPRRIFHALDLL